MDTSLIPAIDAAGEPGPPWLFSVLLVLTFFLHLIFMNLALGGTLLAWFSHLRAKGRADNPNGLLAGRLMGVNAYAISLAITTGVAALLFVQVLYQQFFYTSTILLGGAWFLFLGLLTGGYYAAYLYKMRGAPARGSGGGFWLGVSAIAFFAIAMIHVAVHLVHVQPAKWPLYEANPWSVLADPTYWPRLMHFVLAGIAFSALVMAHWAVRRAGAGIDVAANSAVARTCWRWALWTTSLQVADGFLLMMVLPKDVLLGIMRGGVATLAPLMLSILLGIGLIMMIARAVDPMAKPGLVTGTLAATAMTVAIMSITRQQVRALYLDPLASLSQPRIMSQWGNIALFAVLLVAALATVAYMTRRALNEPASGDEAA